jgi:ribose-phosphate pyrophosphokinase
MSAALIFCLDNHGDLFNALVARTDWESGDCEVRHFPDGESYVRIDSDCQQRDVIILCSLHQPDHLILPLLFCASTARELGARSVGLIAPYLAYMRQDQAFKPGEAVASRIFAKLLSAHIDWLVTIDPHLHRFRELAEIYSIPHRVITAAPLLANWIERHIKTPLLIGPDAESEQWVATVATTIQVPYAVLQKIRHGDRNVEISNVNISQPHKYTAVIVDDIISTGGTVLEAVDRLHEAGFSELACVAVHGLFADAADERLRARGISQLATSNSVAHDSNAIDLSEILVQATNELLVRN